MTEHQEWSERAAQWLPGAVERAIPTLGICYGHQLLAYALGGKVEDNPNGLEYGTVQVELRDGYESDYLFGALPTPVKMHVCHKQSVLHLPGNAKLLASSRMDAHQAFVVGTRAWGVQFHPEFDQEILAEYINHHSRDLRREGQDPNRLLDSRMEAPYGAALLQRFAAIANEADRDGNG